MRHQHSASGRAAALRSLVACTGALALATISGGADAAGLYFSERGVRPLGRGGAFTAGADDLGAMWHNPAGIYDAGSSILADASWLHFSNAYTRQAVVQQRDPNTGAPVASFQQTFPTVDGSTPVIPLPTLGGSYRVHRDWVLALGAGVPYAALASYPETLAGAPAPQRYSLITLEGSALAVVGAWAAWAPLPELRIGAGFELLVGRFASTVMQSACIPEEFFCAPEQPSWDALAQLTAGPILAPSGNIGVKYRPHPRWTLGAAFQAPFFVRAPAEVLTRLPSAPVFETATQEGTAAAVAFDLPWSVRVGVELRPIERLAVELTGAVEGWSMHDEITIEPDGIALRNLVGFPDPYRIATQHIVRNFQNSYAVRAGAEYGIEVSDYLLEARGGVSFESSAVPPEYLSVLTMDMPKVTLGIGGSMHLGAWRLDVVYAHIFGFPVEVAPEDARVPVLSPVEAKRSEPHYVNGGRYDAAGNVLGVGVGYAFDSPPAR